MKKGVTIFYRFRGRPVALLFVISGRPAFFLPRVRESEEGPSSVLKKRPPYFIAEAIATKQRRPPWNEEGGGFHFLHCHRKSAQPFSASGLLSRA